MKVSLKIPVWVSDEAPESVHVLFAFLRKLALKYTISRQEGLDVYASDVRRIVDAEEYFIHEVLMEWVDPYFLQIGRLSEEHYVFKSPQWKACKEVEIQETRNLLTWAYLIGCSNFNLVEPEGDRPVYNPMSRLDRELFLYSNRGNGQEV